jgi:hypothetical protein
MLSSSTRKSTAAPNRGQMGLLTQPIQFMGGVLIPLRVDAPRDALGQGSGAKAVRQADHAEIIDYRIQYRMGQVKARIGLGS